MVRSEWTLRIEKVDGPARRSSYRYGDRSVELPLIFDVEAEVNGSGSVRGKPVSPGWEGVSLSIRNDPENASIFEDGLLGILSRMGIGKMPRAVSFNRMAIDGEVDGERIPLPVTILPMSPLILTDMMEFAGAVGEMISKYPAHPPLYLPGGADGTNVEMLFYLGAEIFDTTKVRLDSRTGNYYTEYGQEGLEGLLKHSSPADICGCSACARMSEADDPADIEFTDLYEHNIGSFMRRLNRCLHHLEKGDLRSHVMGLMSDKPGYASLFRAVETRYLDALASSVPSWRKSGKRLVVYRDDLRSPEFNLWRQDLLDRYRPLPHKDILLLLPCSARKPYSTSRTHQRIRDALSSVSGWRERIQMLVMTSPVGAVPMELDSLYPAAYYDIPVTGKWYPEEVDRIRELVVDIHSKGSYRHVISYHREGKEFFPDPSDYFDDTPYTDVFDTAGRDDIPPGKALRDSVRSAMEDGWDPPGIRSDLLEALNSVNFSLDSDLEPGKGMRIWRVRQRTYIKEGPRILFEMRTGGPVPTIEGGREIWKRSAEEGSGRIVKIDDFTPRGTIFNQGIISVKGRIRPGDIVIVGHDAEYRGVGRALLPGEIMASGVIGPGVKMISHIK